MKLEGVHHVTAITGDAPGNVDFYTRVLGLRLVKKTVNQDDPTVYHLFYADEDGSPGSDITFFEYPGAASGRAGAGMVHRIVWRVVVRGGARLLGRPARRARASPSIGAPDACASSIPKVWDTSSSSARRPTAAESRFIPRYRPTWRSRASRA